MNDKRHEDENIRDKFLKWQEQHPGVEFLMEFIVFILELFFS